MNQISIADIHSFLGRFYHSAVVDLSAEFHSRHTLSVDCNDIKEYNENWLSALRTNPQEVINALEEALATYPWTPPYGQLTHEGEDTKPDEPPFVRLQNYPYESDFDELPELEGQFTSLSGRITKIGEPEARVATAVYICKQCGDTLRQSLIVNGADDIPANCRSCDTKSSYRYSMLHSTLVDSQSVTLSPLDYRGSPRITVELRHELVDSIERNSGVIVSGTVHCTGISGQTPEITVLANAIEKIQSEVAHPTVTYADRFLDDEPASDDEFSNRLGEFVERTKLILDHQYLTEEDAQAKIITPFIHLLGWNVYSEQVRLEYSISGSEGKPDYMLFDAAGVSRIPVEAKSPGKDLDNCVSQIEGYLRSFTSDVGLLTTGEEYRLYQSPSSPDSKVNHIFTLHLSELPANESLIRILREPVVSNIESVSDIFVS